MDRLGILRAYVQDALQARCAGAAREEATAHLHGVSSCCALLAARRGLNADVCAAAGLLHGLYAYATGIHDMHAEDGAEMARVVLKRTACFSPADQAVILSMIRCHANLGEIHGVYEETLKDARVLHPYLLDGARGAMGDTPARLRAVCAELGLPDPPEYVRPTPREAMADLAQTLAALHIEGVPEDPRYLEIIRYFPEREAAAELRSGWCAAFVYHVCRRCELRLPIRPPGCAYRLAGVGAWVQWSQEAGCFFAEDAAFSPVRGDIIVYDSILPADRKRPDSPWHDHIGIVLEAEGEALTVAEGNADGLNVSGIVRRTRGVHIGGYIRIPDCFFCRNMFRTEKA